MRSRICGATYLGEEPDAPTMRALDNPDENPCFGCGPQNPRGLGLDFARDEDDQGRPFVTAKHTPAEDEVGWPWRARRTAHALAG